MINLIIFQRLNVKTKKLISKINLNKHLLTKTHINNFNKVKKEKVDIKTMYSCPCGGRFKDSGLHIKNSHYATKIHRQYKIYHNQVKKEQKNC